MRLFYFSISKILIKFANPILQLLRKFDKIYSS